jgi:hypothetical protein
MKKKTMWKALQDSEGETGCGDTHAPAHTSLEVPVVTTLLGQEGRAADSDDETVEDEEEEDEEVGDMDFDHALDLLARGGVSSAVLEVARGLAWSSVHHSSTHTSTDAGGEGGGADFANA